MRLQSLHIEDYRSFDETTLTIPEEKRIICIVGENGLGKTNFLEALYSLSLTRPFRGKKFEEVVKEGSEQFKVEGSFLGEDQERVSLYGVAKPFQKRFVVNDREVAPGEVVGHINMVLFHPGDISAFVGSPSYRRRYLNILIAQVDPSYTQQLIEYGKVLKQRNQLLKMIRNDEADRNELDYWTNECARLGSLIAQKRIKVVEFLNANLGAMYTRLAGKEESVEVRYVHSATMNEGYTEERLREAMNARIDRDIAVVQTTLGPHRDDLGLTLNERDVLRFASRGEMRTLILAMKLLELEYIEEHRGQTPLLLLDDVFSELDLGRQQFLLEQVRHVQTIITVTHTEPLDVGDKEIMVVEVSTL